MHERPPPRKVILVKMVASTTRVDMSPQEGRNSNSQLGVDTRDWCVVNGPRERAEPTLRLPFQGIVAPKRFVGVAGAEVNEGHRPSRDEHLVHDLAVHTADGLREREDDVPGRAGRRAIQDQGTQMLEPSSPTI